MSVEELFSGFAASIALAIEAVAVLIIVFGAAEATVRLVGRLLRRKERRRSAKGRLAQVRGLAHPGAGV